MMVVFHPTTTRSCYFFLDKGITTEAVCCSFPEASGQRSKHPLEHRDVTSEQYYGLYYCCCPTTIAECIMLSSCGNLFDSLFFAFTIIVPGMVCTSDGLLHTKKKKHPYFLPTYVEQNP